MAVRGIDVSVWQGNIDFAKVKASGIDFVIIRAGYGAGNTDRWFEDNYRKAKQAGLHVGAYWYSKAISFRGAEQEADCFLAALAGKQFDYPVYVDVEEKSQLNAGKDFVSGLIRTFCTRMEKAGYFAGFYTSASCAKSLVAADVLKRYSFWCAQWGPSCVYKGVCGVWQYSSSGTVNGIDGRVDLDYSYQDFSSIIRNSGFNGYKKETDTQAKADLSDRDKIIEQARAWIGKKEADGSFREIIDIYNAHTPLARGYRVKYTDSWCAAFVSAVAIKCGKTDIIPTECGCGQMVQLFQKLGEWDENEARVPNPGDVIFYDWNDNGRGDNTGWPDHVGIVESVSGSTITIIEGNKSNAVGRRQLQVNSRYIRGYGVPRYTGEVARPAPVKKSVSQLAHEVIDGKWGNGDDRKKRIKAAGYDYSAVQKKVNELLK